MAHTPRCTAAGAGLAALQQRARQTQTREPNTKTHCDPLQHTTTHCNPLQNTATHCNTLQHTATHCNTLQHTATHCNSGRHPIEALRSKICSRLLYATHCNTLQQRQTPDWKLFGQPAKNVLPPFMCNVTIDEDTVQEVNAILYDKNGVPKVGELCQRLKDDLDVV